MVCTEEHGLLTWYFLRHSDSANGPNQRLVPVRGETEAESSTESLNTKTIYFISDKNVKDGTDDTLSNISYKDDIDTIQPVNDIIYNTILIGEKIPILQCEDCEVIQAQVKSRAAQFHQEQKMLLVSIGENQATDVMM